VNLWGRIVDALRRPRIEAPAPVFMRVAGVTVSEDSALRFGAVWSCVRIISETIATLGWHVVRENLDGTRERVIDSPLDRMLNAQANAEMTAFSWRETALAHCLLWGNHYSEIRRDFAGRPVALFPIHPASVVPERNADGALTYRVRQETDADVVLPARDVLHIHGLGFDGVVGLSVVDYARQSIGVGLALDKFGASFYENGAHVGMALRHPGKLSPQAKDTLKAGIQEAYSGPTKAFKTVVLEEGMDITKLSMSMVDAQFLDSRKFQISEICRWFRVPPHKVADLDRATFSNIESQAIEFVQDTILPWCRRLEQEVDAKLIGQWKTSTRLNIDTLLRGDIAARYGAYEKGRLGGWLSINDVRRLENMNPIEAGGDVYLQPMNYVEAGTVPTPPASPAASDAQEDSPDDEITPTSNLLTWRPRKEATQ
jgi:HK97 family phage portal protein